MIHLRLFLCLAILCPGAAVAQAVEVVFLDVGQGDAVLIRSPEGNTALIDAGPNNGIVPQLQSLGIRHLDLVVASHPHADHIGGMAGILQAFPVRRYIDNGLRHRSATFREFEYQLQITDVEYRPARPETLELGSVRLETLPLPETVESVNNYSVGVLLTFGEFRALFTGDSEQAELQYFIQNGIPRVTLLKAAHHGSRTGVSPLWVSRTKPEVVVISVGADNAFGHPEQWALNYYELYANVYRTDVHGTVTVSGRRDGTYTVRTGSHIAADAAPAEAPAETRGVPGAASITVEVFANPPGNDNDRLNEEYVVIANGLDAPVDLSGWTLCDLAYHCFVFPQGARTSAGGQVTVHTGIGITDGTRFYYGRRSAVWNNRGDTATLWDARGVVVARFAY